MAKSKLNLNLVELFRADRGQVLVEFSITIPVVLLFFFGMLQYLEVVKATQLANYAAFVAARVYAVRASIEGDQKAQETATKAASLAMAPVAKLHGELGSLGGTLSGAIPSDFPGFLNSLGDIAQGFLVAQNLRFNSSVGGGSVKISTSGNPKQVDVQINYPQPIYIPGLAELWAIVAGDKGIHHSLSSLREGLDGLPSTILPAIELSESQWLTQFAGQSFTLPPVMFPYINVRGLCSLGFSDWGSKDPEFRPRKPDTVTDAGTDPADQARISQAQQAGQAAQDYRNAVQDAQRACNDLCTAQHDLTVAQANHDAVFNNPNSTQAQRDAADQQLQQAQAAKDAAQSAFDSAQQKLAIAKQKAEAATGQQLQDVPCNCN